MERSVQPMSFICATPFTCCMFSKRNRSLAYQHRYETLISFVSAFDLLAIWIIERGRNEEIRLC